MNDDINNTTANRFAGATREEFWLGGALLAAMLFGVCGLNFYRDGHVVLSVFPFIGGLFALPGIATLVALNVRRSFSIRAAIALCTTPLVMVVSGARGDVTLAAAFVCGLATPVVTWLVLVLRAERSKAPFAWKFSLDHVFVATFVIACEFAAMRLFNAKGFLDALIGPNASFYFPWFTISAPIVNVSTILLLNGQRNFLSHTRICVVICMALVAIGAVVSGLRFGVDELILYIFLGFTLIVQTATVAVATLILRWAGIPPVSGKSPSRQSSLAPPTRELEL